MTAVDPLRVVGAVQQLLADDGVPIGDRPGALDLAVEAAERLLRAFDVESAWTPATRFCLLPPRVEGRLVGKRRGPRPGPKR